MKKNFKSKRFIITTMSILCIAILGICWYTGRDKTTAFVPDESPVASASSEWTESSTETETKNTRPAAAYLVTTPATTEAYPKVEEITLEETVISFTPTEKPAETTPAAPKGKTILEDPGPEHPINPAPKVTAAPTEAPASTEPAADSTHQEGAVYDPVFGWVVPSEVIQSTIDSDGDPNKMVGNMGSTD